MGGQTAIGSSAIPEVIRFWFEELEPKDWFRKDGELDATIRSAVRFAL
jgi:uncharacterized protein (DUF924 family)